MHRLVWTALAAAVFMIVGMFVAGVMVLGDHYDHLAFPAILELAGIGFAVLSLREEK
jgi:hypothetical protein